MASLIDNINLGRNSHVKSVSIKNDSVIIRPSQPTSPLELLSRMGIDIDKVSELPGVSLSIHPHKVFAYKGEQIYYLAVEAPQYKV